MPYRLFQGNLNPKDLKRHKIATQSFIFFLNFLIFDTNQGRQTEIYAPELVTLVVAIQLEDKTKLLDDEKQVKTTR